MPHQSKHELTAFGKAEHTDVLKQIFRDHVLNLSALWQTGLLNGKPAQHDFVAK